MKKLFLILLPITLIGCAQFKTKQIDISISYEKGTNKVTRAILTEASANTFFESKSKLTNFKATQTDKTQSATVGSLDMEAMNPVNTNAVNLFESGMRGFGEGISKSLVPKP